MIKKLKLLEIVTDAGTQVRAGLNEATVTDYAEALADGAKFPPVVVFHDGDRYIAADGFHRIQAALRIGATQIECDVRKGGKTDALKFALGCNAHHGLRRTNSDKRHAVGMALKEFPKTSNAAIAEMCLVGHELVAEIRKSQPYDSVGLRPPPVRVGLDGKERKLPPPPMERRETNRTNATDGPPGRMPGSTAGKMPAATLPPPPSRVLDATGWPIPTQLIPLWQRADEVQEMLTALSRVKGALRCAQENNDKLFAEVNFSSALSQLDQAWTDIKTAKPFAVCPTCQGQLPDKCTLCRGRGLISEHRWNTCVTREDKEFRARARSKS
ncbi:MAG TPA: ParB/RepB/Spo0J family partition protein [Verrucomicrobiota bacterium]|nr:ParB/RepB/Spo0J family partition protein [Verrucomicrobiota bacterium]